MVFSRPFFRNLIGQVSGHPSFDSSIHKETNKLYKTPSPLRKTEPGLALDETVMGQASTMIRNSPLSSNECTEQQHHHPISEQEQAPCENSLHTDSQEVNCVATSSAQTGFVEYPDSAAAKVTVRKFKQTSLYTGPRFSLMRSFVRESFSNNFPKEEASSTMFHCFMDTRQTVDEIKIVQTSEPTVSTSLFNSEPMKNSHSPLFSEKALDEYKVNESMDFFEKSQQVQSVMVQGSADNVLHVMLGKMSVNVTAKENNHTQTSLLDTRPRFFEGIGERRISKVTSSVARILNSTTRAKHYDTERNKTNTTASQVDINSVHRRSVRVDRHYVTPRIQSVRPNQETCLEEADAMSSVFKAGYSRPECLMSPCTQRTKSALKRHRLERIAAPQSRKRHVRSVHHNSPM